MKSVVFRDILGPAYLGHALAVLWLAFLAVLTVGCSSDDPPPESTPTRTPLEAPADQGKFTSAKVVEVIDGVTIEVEIQSQRYRIRYLGVQVPEVNTSDADGPSLGESALRFNRFLVEEEVVELERGNVDLDSAGRRLRYVYVGGEMVNMALLANGYVAVASFPSHFEHRMAFNVAEESAKASLRGIWEAEPFMIGKDDAEGPDRARPRFGGTLPLPADSRGLGAVCEYSGTAEPVIKGNKEPRTGERLFHVPGGFFYKTTIISESDGDRWFCTEEEAVRAGWKHSKH